MLAKAGADARRDPREDKMKPFPFLLLSLGLCAALQPGILAQGTIDFRTHVPGVVDAKAWHCLTGEVLDGTRFYAQLYVGTTASSLDPVDRPVSFGTGDESGYIAEAAAPVVVPGFAPGTTAWVQVRAWPAEYASAEIAWADGANVGWSKVIQVELGGTPPEWPPPAQLVGLETFCLATIGAAHVWEMSLSAAGQTLSLSWKVEWPTPWLGVVVEQADNPAGPWTQHATGAHSPLEIAAGLGTRFYRVKIPPP